GARCCHVGNSYAFGSVTTQFLFGGIKELDRRAATEWLKPPPADRVDVAAGYFARHLAGRICKDDHGELQSLRLVHGHNSHAVGAFFHDRSLVRLTAFRIGFHLFDEGAEGGCATLEVAGLIDQSERIGESLLSGGPKRDTGMGTYCLQQHHDGLGDWSVIASAMEARQEGQS